MIALAMLLLLADGPIYLGVLETSANPAVCAHSEPAVIRIAFQFANDHWVALPSTDEHAFPEKVSWVLAFDGKRIGETRSQRSWPSTGSSCEIGTQRIVAPTPLPKIAWNAKLYWTWPGYPPYRPLIAISVPNYKDPDKWKPFHPTRQQFRALHSLFRREIAMPLGCESEPVHNYPDDYIRPIAKGYRSKSGKMLIGFIADAGLNDCMNWPSPTWFLVDSAESTLIGTDITLLDAGDYDGDGSSELLFHMSEYNHDGYVLFRPLDKSKVTMSWKYH